MNVKFSNCLNNEVKWNLNPFVKNIKIKHCVISLRTDWQNGELVVEFQQNPFIIGGLEWILFHLDLCVVCDISFAVSKAIKTNFWDRLNLKPAFLLLYHKV